MSTAATGMSKKTGGCGCGCGGAASARPCSCRKAGCQECETHGLVRPRFFAGQLLTEDDLEALTTYIVSKERLHARHLHGAGVVCGLEVACGPCPGGSVVVRPGYALDCCGNDIVVPCETTLDILAMIRQLRIEQRGGHDCGDPCAQSKAARRTPAATTSSSGAATIAAPASVSGTPIATLPGTPRPRSPRETGDDDTKVPRERYCLYVRYCETNADPVKPFVAADPCDDGGSCEFTRVREGYRFELRCPTDHVAPPTLFDRINECADLGDLLDTIKKAEASASRFRRLERAIALSETTPTAEVAGSDPERIKERIGALTEFARVHPVAPGQPPETQPTDAELRRSIDAFGDLARIAARLGVARLQAGLPDEVEALRGQAREQLAQAEPVLRARLDVFERSEDVLVSRAILDDAKRFVISDAPEETMRSAEARMFILGAVQSTELASLDYDQLVQLRQWLKRRIGAGVASDCRLGADLEAVAVTGYKDERWAVILLRRALLPILYRYLTACVCGAVLPPCPPCDDTAVLLACLTVEECKVIEVCNLERTFVLSWPAMRYWVPWINAIGKGLEQGCCPTEHEAAEPEATEGTGSAGRYAGFLRAGREPSEGVLTESAAAATAASRLTPLESALRVAMPERFSGTERLARLLSRSIVPEEGDMPAVLELGTSPQGEPLAEALRGPEPRRAIDELVTSRLEELRPRSELVDLEQAFEERLATVNTAVSALRKEIRRRPLVGDLANAAPVKKVATVANDVSRRLEAVNAELLDRVQKLTERIEVLEGR